MIQRANGSIMKQTPIEDAIQARMRAGVITREGLLGDDKRPLVDILEEDHAAVMRLGVTHEAIAKRMRAMRRVGAGGLGEPVSMEPHFEITVEGVRGRMPCPFGDGQVPKHNTTVKNLRLNRTLHYSDLQTHLIGRHGFYMGRGFRFRIDPAALVEVLEVPAEETS